MMTDSIRVGVVGCGFFAQNHLHSWKGLAGQGAELVAVCDIDPAKAKAAAENFGAARWHSDTEKMFREEKHGLVDIAAGPARHRRRHPDHRPKALRPRYGLLPRHDRCGAGGRGLPGGA